MMPFYPTQIYDRENPSFQYPSYDNASVVNANYMNYRDDEIEAIERALGSYLVPNSAVSLSTFLKTDGTNVLLAFNGGNVGIGTTTPAVKLHVHGANARVLVSEPGAGQRVFDVVNNGNSRFGFQLDANEHFDILVDQPGYGYVSRLHIDRSTAGNVGIGTTVPGAKLHVHGANSRVLVSEPGTDKVVFDVVNNANSRFGFKLDANENFDIMVDQPGYGYVSRLHIDRSTTGNVGIGTTTPHTRLDIHDGAIEFAAMSDPGAPATNGARLFSRDNGSGKTQLVVRFASGAVQVLATEP